MTRSETPTRFAAAQWTVAGFLLLVFVALAWMQRVPSLTTANDDAMYVLLSRSLREGGFHSIHLVDAPVHTKYPPGFPALLAAVASVAGESTDAFAAMNIALAATGLALIFAVAAHRWGPVVSLGALAVAVASPPLQAIAGTVMSEPAFLALTALTLWLLAAEPLTTRRITLACLCATLAALTRTIGATLILAVIGLLVLQRRWRAASLFAAIIAMIVVVTTLWLQARAMPAPAADYINDALEPGPVVTANPLDVLARRVANNAPQYAAGLLWALSFPTVPGMLVDNLAGLAIAGFALVAGAWLFWRRWRIAALLSLTYGTLILAWPWPVARFLLPILPMLAVMLLKGADELLTPWSRRTGIAVVVGLAAILAATGFARSADNIGVKRGCDREQPTRAPACFNPDQRSLFEAARYVSAHTPSSAIIVSSKEATFHYLTGRPLVSADLMPTERAADFLRQKRVSYVVLGHLSPEDVTLAVRLTGACRGLRAEREFPPRTTVFRVLPSDRSNGRSCEILERYPRSGAFSRQTF